MWSANSVKNHRHTQPADTDCVLCLEKVSKIYRIGNQTIKALNNINLTIKKGEFVAVMGPSGSGKSTFLQIASILASPTQGVIRLNNTDVTKFNEVEKAKIRNQEIGFIFQQFNLLAKTSALDNVALPLVYANVSEKERYYRAKQALERLGLGERLNNTPAQLSGGQQQRVAIARALVNNPSIIFADEPTGNLDSKSGLEVEKILTELHQEGKTIILVTHESEVAQIAKRQIIIKDGKILNDSLNNNKPKMLKTSNQDPKNTIYQYSKRKKKFVD